MSNLGDYMISERGRKIKLIDGHKFRYHRTLKDDIMRWICCKNTCKSYIKTDLNDTVVLESRLDHNHEPEQEEKLRRQIIRNSVKRKAQEGISERPRKLIYQEIKGPNIEEIPVDVKMEMPVSEEMIVPGPSSAYVETFQPEWTVPQQVPPSTKQSVVPPPAPVKKLLPQVSQPTPKPVVVKPAPPRPVSPPQPPLPPPEVCLRWNSYHSNMQATFPSLLNNEQFVDVTLACEGRSIKCHKMMLSACSSYFEELLSQNPCQHPIVLMKDLKFWEVQALVDFMYRGEVNVGQDKLPSLLAAAEALQIKGLAGPASTSSSHDEDSLPPTPTVTTDDYMEESASSPSSARRARKKRTIASLQSTVVPQHRNPVGRPRLLKPSPQPSTSTYLHTSTSSEPPLRRARRSESINLPEIKMEPVDIDISNDSMDPGDDCFDVNKSFDGNSSGRRGDETDCDGGGGEPDITSNISDDNKANIRGRDSDRMDFGNNSGINSDTANTAGDDGDTEIQGYSYTEGGTNDPSLSSSDVNPSYPEVVLNHPSADGSSDSILGHL